MEIVLFLLVWFGLGVVGAAIILKKFWDDFGEIDGGCLIGGLVTIFAGPLAIIAALGFRLLVSDFAHTPVFKKKDTF